jgi:hypothetical protein
MCVTVHTFFLAATRVPSVTYAMTRRVDTQTGLSAAVVRAIPQGEGALAVVRAHDCDSRDGAASLLDALAQLLMSELTARGDVVLAVEDEE